jgi:hypothetical protein
MQSLGYLAILLIEISILWNICISAFAILNKNIENIEAEYHKHRCGSHAAIAANFREAYLHFLERPNEWHGKLPAPSEVFQSMIPDMNSSVECRPDELMVYRQNPAKHSGPNWHYQLSSK